MTITIQSIRTAAAACMFAGFLAGTLTPGFAIADVSPSSEGHGYSGHLAQAPTIQVKRAPGNEHNAIVVSWDEAHYHPYPNPTKTELMIFLGDYRVAIYTTDMATGNDASQDTMACEGQSRLGNNYQPSVYPRPAGCLQRIVPLNGSGRYSETFLGLQPDTSYSVSVRTTFRWHHSYLPGGARTDGVHSPHHSPFNLTPPATSTITTASSPKPPVAHEHTEQPHTHDYAELSHQHPAHAHAAVPEHTHAEVPEHTHEPASTRTTTGQVTPTGPDSPAPAAQTCTYKHRLIGVPGSSTYAGRILVSSENEKATATIRAYQADNGHALDVLDTDGRDVETIDLSPANSIKRFTLEGASGWHKVIVEHPSASAMSAATVAMRYRDPGGSVENTYAPAVEDCQPTTTTETTTDVPTDPVTPPPSGPTGTGTQTGPEPEAPAPEPETTAPTAPELAVALTAAVRSSAGKVAVSGTVTNSGTTASSPTRLRFLNGRQRVHTATVPAVAGGGVHAIRADVRMPEGSAVQVCIVPRGQDADPSNDCATAAVTQ